MRISMKSREKKIPGKRGRRLLYAVCALLVLFYVVVMWWGITPDVGLEYKMYYITHELSDWPGYGNLSYELGTEEIAVSRNDRNGNPAESKTCMRKGQGWEKEQYEGSVNSGGTSYIYYVPNQSAKDPEYTVEISDFQSESPEAQVRVYVNETPAGVIDQKGTYTFDTGSIEQGELLTVRFEADGCSFTLWSACLA